MISSRDLNGFPLFSPFLTTFPRYENIFVTPHHHQASCQTRSFKSTPISLPAGWIFNSFQSKLMTSTLISIHSSNLIILVSASAVDLAGTQLCMHDPVSHRYTTQQAGLPTNSNYTYSHCFERRVGPNYMLLFQASVNVFVLGCRVEVLRFVPFWVRPNSGSKSPDYIWAPTYSTLCFHSMKMFNTSFNEFRIHGSCSLHFNNLKMNLELYIRGLLPQVFR